MSSWDILPPEGAGDSAGAGSGAGTGSAGSVGSAGSEGSAGALAARSFSMSSWDILPPEGAEDSAGAGSGVGTGSAGSVGSAGSAGALAASSFSMSSWDILPPDGAEDSAGAGSSFTGASGALFSTISGSSESESSLPPSAAASSFSMSSWDILPPEGSAGSMISSVGVSTGSAGSAGSADSAGFSLPPDMFISSSILCTSSCDITPPEDSSWERVAGSTCMSETGSGAGESLMPAERSSASMSSCDILLFSTSGAGA